MTIILYALRIALLSNQIYPKFYKLLLQLSYSYQYNFSDTFSIWAQIAKAFWIFINIYNIRYDPPTFTFVRT